MTRGKKYCANICFMQKNEIAWFVFHDIWKMMNSPMKTISCRIKKLIGEKVYIFVWIIFHPYHSPPTFKFRHICDASKLKVRCKFSNSIICACTWRLKLKEILRKNIPCSSESKCMPIGNLHSFSTFGGRKCSIKFLGYRFFPWTLLGRKIYLK